MIASWIIWPTFENKIIKIVSVAYINPRGERRVVWKTANHQPKNRCDVPSVKI